VKNDRKYRGCRFKDINAPDLFKRDADGIISDILRNQSIILFINSGEFENPVIVTAA